jgi:ATP adenylyltransferase
MNNLWAPWRATYITRIDKKDGECVFCKKVSDTDDRQNLILYRGQYSFVVMNLYPYNNGHLMVIPYNHTSDFTTIDTETSAEMWHLLCIAKKVLSKAFNPEGFNVGMNIGRSGGAGIDQHIHIHIVPRWNGDTNFIPVLCETKVISQTLWETYDTLFPLFKSISSSS